MSKRGTLNGKHLFKQTQMYLHIDLPKNRVSTFYSGGHMGLVKYHGCYWEVEEVMVLGDIKEVVKYQGCL